MNNTERQFTYIFDDKYGKTYKSEGVALIETEESYIVITGVEIRKKDTFKFARGSESEPNPPAAFINVSIPFQY
jgi:hypothetical protein